MRCDKRGALTEELAVGGNRDTSALLRGVSAEHLGKDEGRF